MWWVRVTDSTLGCSAIGPLCGWYQRWALPAILFTSHTNEVVTIGAANLYSPCSIRSPTVDITAAELVKRKQAQIVELCRLNQVARLDLFGSATRPTFDAQTSDFDFLVEFATDTPEGAADRFFGLKHGLSTVLGRTVDLVDLAAAKNPYFLQAIAGDRITLYGP
ncbi:nucleotidyltransferase domain-containing protein [Phormidium tenue FACHB-1052]|nr:nucleotidyltransferase domain-containing protein [Phormidium tenue]MBD2234406.1 nucleotidyltransferase domain-containing protein [Phormidium tenue FACHB-1052]